jgi:hypothetical protein
MKSISMRNKENNSTQILLENRRGNASQLILEGQHFSDLKVKGIIRQKKSKSNLVI